MCLEFAEKCEEVVDELGLAVNIVKMPFKDDTSVIDIFGMAVSCLTDDDRNILCQMLGKLEDKVRSLKPLTLNTLQRGRFSGDLARIVTTNDALARFDMHWRNNLCGKLEDPKEVFKNLGQFVSDSDADSEGPQPSKNQAARWMLNLERCVIVCLKKGFHCFITENLPKLAPSNNSAEYCWLNTDQDDVETKLQCEIGGQRYVCGRWR